MLIDHNIPPVYDTFSRILILGSFPSVQSRASAFYYAHPRNRFWRVLGGVFDEPVPLTANEKRAFLLHHRIALWDVIGACDIVGSADATIKNVTPNAVETILQDADILKIFVNGKTAEKYYKKYLFPVTGITAVCLPSTSPANARMKETDLINAWKEIVLYV